MRSFLTGNVCRISNAVQYDDLLFPVILMEIIGGRSMQIYSNIGASPIGCKRISSPGIVM